MESSVNPATLPVLLLIDDDFINREVIKNILQTQYSFVEAENGLEGLEIIERMQEHLSAILLDVNMPIMNGIELLRALNRQGLPERIPIFLITANWEDEISREAYDLGVMDVIAKPVAPHIILRRVSYVVELFAARKTLSATVRSQDQKLQENAVVIDELHRSNIIALSSAIESRDVESGEHTNRIYHVTRHLLTYTAMGDGLTPLEIENMAIGSIMHDVGKIAISDVILNKPGRLTKEEFEVMKQHTVKGEKLMQHIFQMQKHESYRYACDIARHHHERWDGRGYPDGLKGDEISVCAQVVSIADVYDALINPRVYKRSFTPDEAVQMIVNGECGVFNPKLIECFLQVEPELRAWYQSEAALAPASLSLTIPHVGEESMRENNASHEVLDVLLLMTAVKNAYDMIICSNLTQNSFYMIDYDRFKTHCAGNDGVFDDLIAAGASSVPQSHREQFIEKFSRENLLNAFRQGSRSVSLEHAQYADDGQLHRVMTDALLLEDPRTGDVLDITLSRYIDTEHAERSRQRQALSDALTLAEQANNAKSDFLSRMSHDIRTPLNAIIGMTTIIAAHITDPDRIADCLIKISTSSKFLLNLINDILDFSKIESGRLSLNVAQFDLRNTLHELAQVISARSRTERKQVFSLSIDPEIGRGYLGDEFRIRQVLMNLLDNACKYTPAEGHISLEVNLSQRKHRHDAILFRVQDDGAGIRREFLEHLFDPFAQDQSNIGHQGVGLGLSITRNLVHLMNGTLTVESEEGSGSVFTVELPLESTDIVSAVSPDLNVLVVDDELAVCEHAAQLLSDMKVRPTIALSGFEAIELVQQHMLRDPFDVVIVDWKMPEMDGVETVRRIRRIAGPHVLVVVMSAYDWTEIEDTARAAGVDLFLAKPIYEYNLRSALACSEKQLQEHAKMVFHGEKVLVAEDNELNQEVVKTILEMKDLVVDIAPNGLAASEKFASSRAGEYLAVFMDVMMPVMNGYDATRRIRSSDHPEAATIPIYAMTANAFQDDIADAEASGMNGHIAKPIDFDEVTRVLQRILAAKNKEAHP